MIRSMTGFGRFEAMRDSRKFTVEMKSVNHRYFDVNIKMPKKLSMFEGEIRNVLKEYAVRGKVDVFITYEDLSGRNSSLRYNQHLAEEYMQYFEQMHQDFGISNDMKVSVLAKCPDVLTMEETAIDEEETWKFLEEVLRGACQVFVETREREGRHLQKDLVEKLDSMLETIAFIEEKAPEILQEYRTRLEEKMKEILANGHIEESRIAAEVIIFADKMCVDEETVRLKSHVNAMREELLHGKELGRKLDFVAQEMNREANTILSKANNLEVTNRAIELKTEIEKIREQIQNIE